MVNKYERRRRLEGNPGPHGEPLCLAADVVAGAHRASRPPGWLRRGRRLMLPAGTGAAVVFLQTARHEFVNCDDDEYVYKNLYIQARADAG